MDHRWDGYKVTTREGKHVKKHLLQEQNRGSTTSSLDNKCSITATTGMKIGTNLCQHYNHNLLLPKKNNNNNKQTYNSILHTISWFYLYIKKNKSSSNCIETI